MNRENKQTQPLVSILMPYYELGDLLQEAVSSVIAQTYPNWELVIVDDCSPNCSAVDALSNFRDQRIKIIRHEKNLGNASGRNTAAKNSTGAIYLSLDSDDLLEPTYIEKTVDAMFEAEASAVYTDIQIFGFHNYVYRPSADLGDIIAGHYPHNTFIYKKEVFDLVGGYKNIEAVVDTEFWISALEIGTKFAYVPEPLWRYRKHSSSWSQNYSSIGNAFYKVLIQHIDTAKKHVPRMLEDMIQRAENDIQQLEKRDKPREDYQRMHKEFHDLLHEYERLEKQAQKTEEILGSLPKLVKQLTYVTMKKVGLKS